MVSYSIIRVSVDFGLEVYGVWAQGIGGPGVKPFGPNTKNTRTVFLTRGGYRI